MKGKSVGYQRNAREKRKKTRRRTREREILPEYGYASEEVERLRAKGTKTQTSKKEGKRGENQRIQIQ
jgi:hypothetical protein